MIRNEFLAILRRDILELSSRYNVISNSGPDDLFDIKLQPSLSWTLHDEYISIILEQSSCPGRLVLNLGFVDPEAARLPSVLGLVGPATVLIIDQSVARFCGQFLPFSDRLIESIVSTIKDHLADTVEVLENLEAADDPGSRLAVGNYILMKWITRKDASLLRLLLSRHGGMMPLLRRIAGLMGVDIEAATRSIIAAEKLI